MSRREPLPATPVAVTVNVWVLGVPTRWGLGNMALEAGRADSLLFLPHCNWWAPRILCFPGQYPATSAQLSQAATPPETCELGAAGAGASEDNLRPVPPPQASGSISPSSGHDPVSSSQTVCLESRGSIMPVGVGGVMMMLGTSRCLSLRTGAWSWLLPLLLPHIFKPVSEQGGLRGAQSQREHVEGTCCVSMLPAVAVPSLSRVSTFVLSPASFLHYPHHLPQPRKSWWGCCPPYLSGRTA